ncbi:30S ribosomal protein S9 [Candidatus Vidania fulgoroideorum]
MKKFFYSGKGKKKSSTAKVYAFEGKGVISFIKKKVDSIFLYRIYKLINFLDNKYNINIYVSGGGKIGQVNSVEYAISKILIKIKPQYKKIIRELNIMSDNRKVERKKIGFVKSRKRKQFSKR